MGRVSKRNQIAELNQNGFITEIKTQVVYKTAIYARLSGEDTKGGKHSDTLNTQIYLIEKYLEDKPYLQHTRTFSDNGFSGTNFQRPGFEELMSAVRKGEINCIVVKDLSRLGRNYLETGKYIESIFPFMGVRFIAINDGYDSNNPVNTNIQLSVSIKNLTNDRFAHDISKKINASFETLMKNGDFIGSYAPYGYLKSPENKHRLIIDHEVAHYVLRIFKLRIEGKSYGKIADIYNAEGIESPYAYKLRKGVMKERKSVHKAIWIPTQIRKILSDPVYIGHIVQGKTSISKFSQQKYVYNSPDRQHIVENMHEAIVPIEMWDRVQELFAETKEYHEKHSGKKQRNHSPDENILKGKIFCGDCGHSIRRAPKFYTDGRRYHQYSCTYKNGDGKYCPSKFILEEKLFDTIYKAIKLQMNLCADYKQILEYLEKTSAYTSETDLLESEYKQLIEDKQKIQRKKAVLYDDYAEGNLSKEDYIMLTQKYDDEIGRYSSHLDELEMQISTRKVLLSPKNDWITAFEKFKRQRKLSKEMVDLLIHKIIFVGDGRLEIQFNFQDEFTILAEELQKMNMEVGDYE